MAGRRSTAAGDAKVILNRIRQLVQALRGYEREAQARFGLGAAQMFIVHVLQQEGELSINALAERTATDQSSVSVAVARLVDDGYVRREVTPHDRRQIRLSLTAKGRNLVRRSPPAAQERILAGVQALAASDRAQLMRLLDDVIAGVTGPAGAAPMLFQDGDTRPRARAAPPPPGRLKR